LNAEEKRKGTTGQRNSEEEVQKTKVKDEKKEEAEGEGGKKKIETKKTHRNETNMKSSIGGVN
jgi:hypothetical protein